MEDCSYVTESDGETESVTKRIIQIMDDLPTVKKISRIQDTDDGATYQGIQITHYKEIA